MHRKNTGSYDSGIGYRTQEDSNSIGTILDIAIDGGIYILKEDGSMLKLFKSPEYRLESLSLNNLPENYNMPQSKTPNPEIIAAQNLKYVYMLLDNRVYIFEPNSPRFQDTKSLNYK